MRLLLAVSFIALLAGGPVAAQTPDDNVRPWRRDARFQRIAAALADTRVIDNHTHLVRRQPMIESDVRNLEEILADPRFFGTQFVLIHGGAPLIEQAAYLAGNKANVWVDTSALPFLYPTTELAAAFRKYLAFAPDRTLFGTDAGGPPTVPVGALVQHLALVPAAREALTLALSDLVRDGVFDEATALRIGKAVLRDNARRLYGF